LPPGCNVSEIPGNTPADLADEALMDEIYNLFDGLGLDEGQQDTLAERIAALAGLCYGRGFDQAQADEALARYWKETTEAKR
jgi:hypothetical protein